MKITKATANLKRLDKTAFKALNMIYGFNFENEIKWGMLENSFTVKKCLDITDANPYTHKIVVVIVPPKKHCWANYLPTIEIIGTGSTDYENFKCGCKRPRNTKIDWLNSKKSVEELRKNNTMCFVIAQKKTLLAHKYTLKERDYTQRFSTEEQKTIIYERTHLNFYYNTHKEELQFDKSGYLLTDKRDNLKRKANALRKERQKNEYLATDNTKQINDLWVAITDLKKYIISKLEQATTYKDIDKISDYMWKFDGLSGVFNDYEFIKEHNEKRDFSSVESFNNAITKLYTKIENIKKGVA